MIDVNWIKCYIHLLLLSFIFVGGAVPRSTLLLAIAGSVSVFLLPFN